MPQRDLPAAHRQMPLARVSRNPLGNHSSTRAVTLPSLGNLLRL